MAITQRRGRKGLDADANPICHNFKKDCNAIENGQCSILTYTTTTEEWFAKKNYKCPFYKAKNQGGNQYQ